MADREQFPNLSDETWRYLTTQVLSYAVLPHENVEDVFAGGYILGRRRADVIGRDFYFGEDVPYGLSLFCYWIWKPRVSIGNRRFLQQYRWSLFERVSTDRGAGDRLLEAVPNEILALPLSDLFQLLREGDISRVIRI